MQSVSSRIWTRVAVSIFFDDNHYTTGTPTPTVDSEIIPVKVISNVVSAKVGSQIENEPLPGLSYLFRKLLLLSFFQGASSVWPHAEIDLIQNIFQRIGR